MKHVPVLALLLLALRGMAQPDIPAGMASREPGQHFLRSYCDTVAPGGAGPAQTWDMSTVPGCDTPILYDWITPGPAAPAACTAVLHYGTTSSLDFFAATPAAFQLLRTAPFPNEAWTYDDPLDVVRYPMSFGDTYTDTFSGIHAPPGGAFSGTHTVTYDAYGAATMPWGTVSGVFRLHIQDTLYIPAEDFRSYTLDAYEYFSPDLREPLVRITNYRSLDGSYRNGGTSLFVADPTGVDEHPPATALTLTPDPAQGAARVRTDERVIAAQAIDAVGRMHGIPFTRADHELLVDVSALTPGTYCLLLRTDTGLLPVRFVKE